MHLSQNGHLLQHICYRAETVDIWDSWILVKFTWGTYDLVVFKIIFVQGHFLVYINTESKLSHLLPPEITSDFFQTSKFLSYLSGLLKLCDFELNGFVCIFVFHSVFNCMNFLETKKYIYWKGLTKGPMGGVAILNGAHLRNGLPLRKNEFGCTPRIFSTFMILTFSGHLWVLYVLHLPCLSWNWHLSSMIPYCLSVNNKFLGKVHDLTFNVTSGSR